MSQSLAVQLINVLLGSGKLSHLEAANRRKVLAEYEKQLEVIRPKVRVVAHLLGMSMGDPYIIACCRCLASGRHDYDDDEFMAPDPQYAMGGLKMVARCARCGSICEYVRNRWTKKNQSRRFPSREAGLPEDQMSDRDRYLSVRDLIEPHEASLLLDIIRFYRKLEAEALKAGIELKEPLKVF